ncbi:MAG: DcaP family trimeric outer membrane transporter [Aureliella sp.]
MKQGSYSKVLCSLLTIAMMVIAGQQCSAQTLLFQPTPQSQFRIGGFAKLDSIFDFDDAGNRFQFDPRTIPIGGENNQQLTLHAKQTRLNIGYKQETDYGPLEMFVEGDFFGVGDTLRLRHAYGRWDNWLAGQTWSTLVDIDSGIETLDIGGADGPINIRRPQLRCTIPVQKNLIWNLSMEDNTAVLSGNVDGETRNRIPVFASGFRWGNERNHLYCFQGISEARFVPDSGGEQTAPIWVIGLSGRVSLANGDSFVARVLGGDGADALVNFEPTINPISSIDTLGGYFFDTGYKHYWNEKLRSNIAFRLAGLETAPDRPDDSLRRNQYFATNLIWQPVKNVDIGIEYLFGERINRIFESGSANRMQFSIIWRLP